MLYLGYNLNKLHARLQNERTGSHLFEVKCIEKAENREVLLKNGKNPAFYSENREDTGFLAVTSGSAAQSSVIDDFATLPDVNQGLRYRVFSISFLSEINILKER